MDDTSFKDISGRNFSVLLKYWLLFLMVFNIFSPIKTLDIIFLFFQSNNIFFLFPGILMDVLTGDLQESCMKTHTCSSSAYRLRQEDHMLKSRLSYLAVSKNLNQPQDSSQVKVLEAKCDDLSSWDPYRGRRGLIYVSIHTHALGCVQLPCLHTHTDAQKLN